MSVGIVSGDDAGTGLSLVMSLWDTRNSTTCRFSFLMGTMSIKHQKGLPAHRNRFVNGDIIKAIIVVVVVVVVIMIIILIRLTKIVVLLSPRAATVWVVQQCLVSLQSGRAGVCFLLSPSSQTSDLKYHTVCQSPGV